MAITVRNMEGVFFPLELKPSETILGIKKKLEKALGPATDHIVLYGDKVLDNSATIASYHFKDGTTLDIHCPESVGILLVGNRGVGKTSILNLLLNPLSKLSPKSSPMSPKSRQPVIFMNMIL